MKNTFHTFKAQSNSSKRVRFAADAVDNSVAGKKIILVVDLLARTSLP